MSYGVQGYAISLRHPGFLLLIIHAVESSTTNFFCIARDWTILVTVNYKILLHPALIPLFLFFELIKSINFLVIKNFHEPVYKFFKLLF